MAKDTVILLCNLTDAMAEPWVAAGYRVLMVDPQHLFVTTDGLVTRFGGTIVEAMPTIGELIRSNRVAFVAGFPPCTDVAVSGARWFGAKRKEDPWFQAKAAIVAEQCRTIGAVSGAPWMWENPVSVFTAIFGEANHTFDPCDFTGYCADDNYTKKTCLRTGGGFVMPKPFRDLTLGPPDDRIFKAPPGPDRANFRSAFPLGFCRAVFLANTTGNAANDNGRLAEAA